MVKSLSVIYKVELTITVKNIRPKSWGTEKYPKTYEDRLADMVEAQHTESLRLCFPPKTNVEQVISYLKERYGKAYHSVQSVSIDGYVDVIEELK